MPTSLWLASWADAPVHALDWSDRTLGPVAPWLLALVVLVLAAERFRARARTGEGATLAAPSPRVIDLREPAPQTTVLPR